MSVSYSRLPHILVTALVLALPSSPVSAHNGADAVFSSVQPPSQAVQPVAVTGTVVDVIVENRVTGATTRYIALRLDEGRTLALQGPGLDALPGGSRVDAVGRNVGNTLFVTDARVTGVGPTSAAGPANSAQGTLTVFHADYFAEGRGEYGLVVQGNDGRATQLNMPVVPDTLRAGMSVIAEGTVAANGFALDVSTITVLANPSADFNPVTSAVTTNNVLVLPIKFSDSPVSDAFSPATISTEFQTKVAPFYQEQSFGQQLLNVTVACYTTTPAGCAANTSPGGWLLSSSATPAACNFTNVGQLADSAAIAAGYTLSNYKNRFYIMPYNTTCGWAGLAYIGSPYQAWGNGYYQLWVTGHELGHNFTLWHAGWLYCPGTSIGPGCTGTYAVSEYGDPWDVMGNVYPGHFNAMQKSALNWLPSGSVKTHSSGTASYTLFPLESAGQSTYAVKIPAAANRTYWIEYRQPIGFDSSMYSSNGAQIRVASPFEFPCTSCGGDDTQVLDMTLGTPGTFTDAALLQGQSYVDSQYGITVNVTNVVTGPSGSLTLSVAMGGKTSTTTTLASSANPSIVGASVTFTASVTGSAPTGTVAFTDGGTTISGCGAVALPTGSASTKTATCSTSSLSVGTHSIVATYGGDSANNGSTSSTLSQVVNNVTTSSTTLASSANPSVAGASVTFTATVTGTSPTGTVALTDGGTTISGCGAVALPTGAPNTKTATCSTSSMAAGTHSIVAIYSGDAGNTSSTSSTLSQVVKTASTTALASSANPSIMGAGITFTATVTGSAPTGTVAFTADSLTLAGCGAVAFTGGTVNARTATCTTSALSESSHSIVASYSGDAGNTTSNTAPFFQTVKPVFADFDGDHKADILWYRSTTGATAMWLMNGVNVKSAVTMLVDPNWQVTQVGDFNGDGQMDLLWHNSANGQTAIWLMNGTTIIGGGTIMADPNWSVTQVGDFNGDGKTDLVWRNSSSGQTAIWLMNGMSIIGGGTIMGDPNWVVTKVGDFNGDGKTDLVWRNSSSGQTAIWLMNGATPIGGGTIMGDANWVVTQVGDFDGDGKTDLLWRNSSSGQTAMWLMNGAALASGGTIMTDANWTVTQVGDFDGDGKTDLVWRNSSNGQTAIWLMNGTTFASGQTILGDGNWFVTNVGDFDGNGKSDLLWRNSSTGATLMWLMNGASMSSSKTLQTDGTWSVATPK